MKFRKKDVCGKCKHLSRFPHVHCNLGSKIRITKLPPCTFIPSPYDWLDCRNKRQSDLDSKQAATVEG